MQQPPCTVPTKLPYLICQVFEGKAAGWLQLVLSGHLAPGRQSKRDHYDPTK
jgi:hypothetical protein